MENINRNIIIGILKDRFIEVKQVYAYWLEGADSLNAVDEYSDIDIWMDVEDGYEDMVFKIAEEEFAKLGKLDFKYRLNHDHPKIRQNYYHIEGTSEYLIIDFCIQCHSRDRDEVKYVEGDILEFPKVIFDKDNVITIVKEDEKIDLDVIRNVVDEVKGKYMQHSRVIKYVERNNYPEAFIYYIKYVAEPLVKLIRLKYTPKYYYLPMIHISNHVPKEYISILESYYKIASLEDIRKNTIRAKETCRRLISEIEEIYNIK
jgi:hypothetical protein